MSKLSDDFLNFLLVKHKQTGQNSFYAEEYNSFDGYREAIEELSNRGVIVKENDILGTITVRPPVN